MNRGAIIYALGSLIWMCSCLGSLFTEIIYRSNHQAALANVYLGLMLVDIFLAILFSAIALFHFLNNKKEPDIKEKE